MKKLLTLLFLLAFTSVINAQKVTEQQALLKAQNFFKEKRIRTTSRTRSVEKQSVADQEDYYIFNAEDNGGYVIISGDDRTPEVLGYADSGYIDMDNLPPNLKGWLEEYSKQIKALGTVSNIEYKSKTRAVTRSMKAPIEPLITAQWGQGSPYNNQCPEIDGKHCVTGCVATAMAQVMYYHKWPQEPCAAIPQYTTGTRHIEMPALPSTTFKWSAMRDRYWEGEQGESADAVAELMRYCGQAVEMNYDINESSAFEMPRHLIQYFGYSKNAKYVTMSQYTESLWEEILYKELSEGRPMLYGGSNLNSAHEFICDGYDGDGYYHFNWGWKGEANGYYLLSILYRTMYCGYVNAQTAIIGLEPEKGEMARPYVYGYNGGELTQTNYSRSSTSDNFTNITLNGGIYIQYEVDVSQDVTIDYGLGLYQGDQLLSVLNQSTATLNIDKSAVANEMSFSFGGDLGDGTYQIRHIYKYPNSEIWQTCYDAYLNYIVATISGTTMTLRNAISPDMQEADYIVNDVSFDPGIFNDNITMVTVNLTNTGDTNQELINFWVRSGENSQGYDLICGFIPPGETGNVVFPTDLHEKGEITMCISSKINRENVRWEKVITMPEYQECKLSCTDYSIKNFNNGILKDSKLQVTLTIKNTGDKNFNGPISYILAEYIGDTRVFTNVVRQLQTVTLNKGESTTFDAVIPHLENNTWYQLTLFCGAAGGEVIYFPDCFNLDFFAAIHSCSYEGLNYVYGPGAKTANVIAGDYQQLNSVSIPSSISVDGQSYKVTEIAPKAFNNCHFQSVILPEGLECIRSYAFQGCEIKSINLPSSLKHISDYAFYSSSGIKEMALPEGLVSIGPSAFSNCRDLEILRFPSTLKSIDYGVISNCNNLKSVYSAMADPIKIAENTFEYIDFSGSTPKQVPPPATITLYIPKGSVSKYQEVAGWNAFARITDKLPYKLTYYVDGEVYQTYMIEEETSITPETAPTKEGYTFSGWSEIPETMPANDVTITGTFSINKYKLIYKVDNVEYKNYEVEYGATITPETAPTKEGYTFSGWSEIPETMPASDVTVTGTFTVNKYKLVYKVDGEEYKSYEVEYGATITPETAPTKEGYTFSGWSEIPETMPASDVTVTGTFTVNKYKLVYKVDGEEYKSYEVEYGATITPEAAPTKEGYTFSGWSEIPETMPASDVTVTGTFTVNKYKLVYKVDGEDYKAYEIEYGATITPETAPTKEGYTFSGWSEIPETMPSSDVTVTGTFTVNKYKLVYKVDGEEYKSYEVEYGTTITPEAAPTKEGFEFSGWSTIPATMPAKDVTITGSFKAVVTDGGGSYEVSGDEAKIVDGENASGDVEIPKSVNVNGISYPVTIISEGAYQNNKKITSATIPESVTTIGANAFDGCSNLGSVNIGQSVSAIGSKAFANLGAPAATRGASGLTISCYATSVPTTAADAFENTPIGSATLLVDDSSVAAYKTTAPWSGFGTIMGFNEATGINHVWFNNDGNAKIFSIDGKPLNSPQKGINIIRMDDGKTKKVVVK